MHTAWQGSAAVPTLLDILDSADLSTGHGANIAKRALHALGEAESAPTPTTVAQVRKVAQATRGAIEKYLQQLASAGTSFPELFDPTLVRNLAICKCAQIRIPAPHLHWICAPAVKFELIHSCVISIGARQRF